ncbi:Fungalysin metallopeptidase-domain-containing protein, partial [Gorgonomyces haynaldii]
MLFAAAASFVLLSVQAHDLQYVKRGDSKVPFFYPKSESKQAPASLSPAKDTTKAAIQLIAQEYNVRPEELKVSNAFTTPRGITHVYLDRVINGVVVANHNAAVHFTNGVPSSVTSSFGHADSFAQPQVVNKISISAKDAISAAEKYLGAKKNQIPVKKHFLELPGGKIALCYDLQVQSDNVFASVSVDAASGQVVRVVNFNNDFTYKAVELPKWTPDSGFSDVKDPEFAAASPNGWTAGSTTTGNNADVHTPSNVRGVGTNGKFDSTFDVKKDAEDPKNVQAGSVNLFYVVNKMHDISYQYGFNEAAGNFQNNNFGKGGIGNDAVNVIHQTGRQNNAFFSTPPDGQQGVMKMFVFNNGRDGGLDSVIPMHEFTHGISNRLTGGPNNIGCLNSMESGSMGEGWSDAVALFLHRNKSETRKSDRGVGTWVGGEPETGLGARSYKYSTDLDVNPLTFDIVGTGDEVHDIGTAWATMLNEVYWNLVDKNGFSENWYDAKQSAGNIVALQLVISGMMLQPCNPTFTQARDAILQADKNLYGGVHQCDIWKGFAKRGLGIDAVQSTHANGFKLPEQCNAKPTTSASSTVATSTSIPTSSSATSIKTS